MAWAWPTSSVKSSTQRHVLVSARGEGVGHRRSETALEAQAAVLLAPVAAEQPARGVERLLHRESVVDDAGDDRGRGLRLALAAHRPVDQLGAVVAQQHARGQRVGGALAGREAVVVGGVERERAAAVLQQQPGVAGDHARAPLGVDALDHAGGVAVAVDGAAERRVAGGRRRGERARRARSAERRRRARPGSPRRGGPGDRRPCARGRSGGGRGPGRRSRSRARADPRRRRDRRPGRRRRAGRAARGSAARRGPASSAAGRARSARGSRRAAARPSRSGGRRGRRRSARRRGARGTRRSRARRRPRRRRRGPPSATTWSVSARRGVRRISPCR